MKPFIGSSWNKLPRHYLDILLFQLDPMMKSTQSNQPHITSNQLQYLQLVELNRGKSTKSRV